MIKDLQKKDGCVGLIPLLDDGVAKIFTTIPRCTPIGPMEDYQKLLQKAGFEDDDSVAIEYTEGDPQGDMKVCITIQDPNLSLRQLDARLKAFVACLKDSGVMNPIVSRISPEVARASVPRGLHH